MPLAAPRARAAAALAAGALLVLAACGDNDDSSTPASEATSTTAPAGTPTTVALTTTTAGTVLAVTVRGGQVVEGAARQRANLNQPVTVRVTSDAPDQVHVHGYDKYADVGPGRVGEVTFVANIPGVFEVELEQSHRRLFTLEVR